MSFCHECGEEVAEIDLFCPFCGISIQPVQVSGGEVEESQANTIAIDQSEVAETLGEVDQSEKAPAESNLPVSPPESVEAVNSGGAVPVPTPQVSASDDAGIGGKTDDYPRMRTEENLQMKTDSIEISEGEVPQTVPEIGLSEQPPAVEEPVSRAVSEQSQPPEVSRSHSGQSEPVSESFKPETSDVIESTEPISTEAPRQEFSPSAEPSPQPFPTGQTGEPPETEAVEKEETGTIESEVSGNEIGMAPVSEGAHPEAQPPVEFSDQIPPVTGDSEVENGPPVQFEKDSPSPVGEEETVSEEQGPPARFSGETPSIVEAVEPDPVASDPLEISPESGSQTGADFTPEPVENPFRQEDDDLGASISKPDIELEPEITDPGGSQFDSVRIIENYQEKTEEPVEETEVKVPPIEPRPQPQPEKAEPVVAAQTEPEEPKEPESDDARESRSYTTPNIGVGDTDGKKAKLKPLDEGTVLNGRYEIVRKIGGGGMGAVYLASDKNLGGVLRAVKEMVQSYIEETQQEKAINDFQRESILLTSLDHPAIPTIYDYFFDEKEGRFYLVMKYINGGDLASRLRAAPNGQIEEQTVVEWAAQIADVLDYLHKRQPPIVYRDLKPANIMIDGNTGRIMLIDFGIARWINKEEKGVTAVGTMGYAPPELFSGKVEPRSDIYSLGSTMFHLLTGSDPQNNPLLIFDFQKNPRPRQINPKLSDQIERILMQSVEYNAEKRIRSAAKMRQELDEHLENLKANKVTYGVRETPQAVPLSDEKVFCGFCGQSIVASDLFCAFCGAKQPIAQKGVHAENYASAPMTAKLMILGTNELESPTYTIEKDDNLVGRRDPMSNIFPEVDLSKFDPQTKISRRHARIWREGNQYLVEDLGSSNGTLLLPVVNEAFRLVPNKPHVLTNGDKIKLGDTTLHFVLG
ncbi:MAG: protein kinase [Pyrinomonadaceae bacterium]